MSNGETVKASEVIREVPKGVARILRDAEEEGWSIRRKGHKFRIYCPCGQGSVRVAGTPRNEGWEIKRIRREMRHCPNRHDLDH